MAGLSVLILDSDTDSAAFLGSYLQKRAGFLVAAAADGREGLRELRRFPHDIVLLAGDLPCHACPEMCSRLRKVRDVPLIVLGCSCSPAETVLALDSGADDYVHKPIDPLVLAARIRAVLRRGPRAPAPDVADELHLNHRTRHALVQGERISLTRTECNLLRLFLAHPGQTLSREFIRASNWGDAQLYVQSRTIDMHVQRLRRKIEPDPASPRYILTVTGVGYRCEA